MKGGTWCLASRPYRVEDRGPPWLGGCMKKGVVESRL